MATTSFTPIAFVKGTNPLLAGTGKLTGNIDWSTEHDTFQFAANPFAQYQITITPSVSAVVAANIYLSSNLKAGIVTPTAAPTANNPVTYVYKNTDAKSKNIVIDVGFNGAFPVNVGGYTVQVDETARDFIADDIFSDKLAGKLDIKSPAAGATATGISSGNNIDWAKDVDVFNLPYEANSKYTVTFVNDASKGLTNGLSVTQWTDTSASVTKGVAMAAPLSTPAGKSFSIAPTSAKGTAHFSVKAANGTDTGLYDVVVTQVKDDYLTKTDATAIKLTTNTNAIAGMNPLATGTLGGQIQWSGDEDWFKATLDANSQYQVTLSPTGTGGLTTSKLDILLAGSTKGSFTSKLGSSPLVAAGSISQIIQTGSTSETDYFQVFTNAGLTGGYNITLDKLEQDDYDASIKTKATLALTNGFGTVSGRTNWAGDDDWIKFVAQPDVKYEFVLNASHPSGLSLTATDLSNANPTLGTQFTANGSAWDFVLPAGSAAQTIYLPLAHATGTGNWTLSGSAIEADDYASTTKTLGLLSPQLPPYPSVTGAIQWAGDKDWFKLTTQPGEVYDIQLGPLATSGYSAVTNVTLNIYDKSGAKSVAGVAPVSGVTYSAGTARATIADQSSSNVYYIEASSSGGNTGGYQLYSWKTVDDIPATIKTEAMITVPSAILSWPNLPAPVLSVPAPGVINWGGDRDWFNVSLESDAEYTITVTGDVTAVSAAFPAALSNVDVKFHDSKGTIIPNTGGTSSSTVTFKYFNPDSPTTPKKDAASTFFVDVGSSNVLESNAGYTVTVSQTMKDDISASLDTTASLTYSQAGSSHTYSAAVINGQIDSPSSVLWSDHDWIAFTTPKVSTAVKFHFQVYYRGVYDAVLGTYSVNPSDYLMMKLLDSSGKSLATQPYSSAPGSNLYSIDTSELQAGKTYYLDVSNAQNASLTGCYTVNSWYTLDDYTT